MRNVATLSPAAFARMQVPLAPVDVADRTGLAEVPTRYGTTALAELTHPAVLAINRPALTEAGRSSDLGMILDHSGREPNRLALGALFAKAQAKGVVGAGDPDRMCGQFFSLLLGDLPVRLLLCVIEAPDAEEIRRRAVAATGAVLALNGPG
jgi:hypothetical protein